jgi:hypothetical protein
MTQFDAITSGFPGILRHPRLQTLTSIAHSYFHWLKASGIGPTGCFKCFEITAAKSHRSASDANADAGMMIPIPLSIGRIIAFFGISTP